MPISRASAMKTTWSAGPRNATAEKTIRLHGNTFLMTPSVTKISMNTVDGATHPITARFGSRAPRWWDGRRIVTVTGLTLRLGATRGWTMSLGVLHRSTTVAGSRSAVHGVGCRADREWWAWHMCGPFMHQRL